MEHHWNGGSPYWDSDSTPEFDRAVQEQKHQIDQILSFMQSYYVKFDQALARIDWCRQLRRR